MLKMVQVRHVVVGQVVKIWLWKVWIGCSSRPQHSITAWSAGAAAPPAAAAAAAHPPAAPPAAASPGAAPASPAASEATVSWAPTPRGS